MHVKVSTKNTASIFKAVVRGITKCMFYMRQEMTQAKDKSMRRGDGLLIGQTAKERLEGLI